MISAPKVLQLSAIRFFTDQLWLLYRFEYLDGTPIDIRNWGLTMVPSLQEGSDEGDPLPVSVIGDNHDNLQLLAAKPADVLNMDGTNTRNFILRMFMQDVVGQVSLTYTYLGIIPRPPFVQGDDTFDTGSIYPESWVIRVDPDTEEIVEVLQDPGAPGHTNGLTLPWYVVTTQGERNSLASGGRKFIEFGNIVYLYRPGAGLSEFVLL